MRQLICASLRTMPSDRPSAKWLRDTFADILPKSSDDTALQQFARAVIQIMAEPNHNGVCMNQQFPPQAQRQTEFVPVDQVIAGPVVNAPAPQAAAPPPLIVAPQAQQSVLTENMTILTSQVPGNLVHGLVTKAIEMAATVLNDETLTRLISDECARQNCIAELLLAFGCCNINVNKSSLYKSSKTVVGYKRPQEPDVMMQFGERLRELGLLHEFKQYVGEQTNADDKMDVDRS
eukprot:TRINITY_DN2651_c0_g1_i1.p1 TRINITY_DN2651_c0_g1~~TRINITY_DN2651_c0_g1_i1.p1  ORF type:complete len:234 (-),score=44.42 TRINITY_DN2651_c0_g1_i1:2-703(-)